MKDILARGQSKKCNGQVIKKEEKTVQFPVKLILDKFCVVCKIRFSVHAR